MWPIETNKAGLTLLELVITSTLLGILVLAVMPLVATSVKRQRESQLRAALAEIRAAIDDFRRDALVMPCPAIISPAGTGVVYVATSARLSYALGEEREMPPSLVTTNRKGVPVVSILVSAVVGLLAFGPFKSWGALVTVITATTAIMYAFAPVSLAALQKIDGARARYYRMPMPGLLLPAAFCSANLVIYWGGFDTTWKLVTAICAGLAFFTVGAWRARTGAQRTIRNALWIGPWLGGQVLIGMLGRYGNGAKSFLPDWVDIAVVIIFSLGIYYWAVSLSLTEDESAAAVMKDTPQLRS